MKFLLSWLIAMMLSSLALAGDKSCTNEDASSFYDHGDGFLWNLFQYDRNYPAEYKKWAADYFELHKEDWDEGWGWAQHDPHHEFPKMLTAIDMFYGVSPDGYGRWKVSTLLGNGTAANGMPDLSGSLSPSSPAMVVDETGSADVIIRNGSGEIIRYVGNVLDTNPTLLWESVTGRASAPDAQYADFLVSGAPAIISAPGAPLRVLGLSDHRSGQMVLFSQVGTGLGGNYRAKILAPSAKDFVRNPVVVRESEHISHVFGVNNNHSIVHFRIVHESDLETEVTVERLPYIGDISWSERSLAAVYQAGWLDVFGIKRADGRVVHFFKKTGAQQWGAEDILSRETYRLDVISDLSLLPGRHPFFVVFGRTPNGSVIRLANRCTYGLNNFGGAGCAYWSPLEWHAENLTQLASIVPSPLPSNVGFLDNSIFQGLFAYRAADGTERILGLGPGVIPLGDQEPSIDHVKLYFKDRFTESWKQTDVTLTADRESHPYMTPSSVRIATSPVFLSGPYTLRIYGINLGGDLVEYRCLDFLDGFSVAGTCTVGHPKEDMVELGFPSLELLRIPPGAMSVQESFQVPNVIAIKGGMDASAEHQLIHHRFLSGRAWHSTDDYQYWASGYYHDFHYKPFNSELARLLNPNIEEAYARASWGWFQKDLVRMWCPAFTLDDSPAYRAAAMLHEATHILFGWSHQTVGGANKDNFLVHTLREIGLGELDPARASHKHSMYQIQAEFLADIAEYPAFWIPLDIRASAANTANWILSDQIINDVGWQVGVPRPL